MCPLFVVLQLKFCSMKQTYLILACIFVINNLIIFRAQRVLS